MPDTDAKYFMTISLNVLNHMGLNLYSNTPAVVAEVIANSWDADATSVDVDFDIDNKTIRVTDDGCGMSLEDVNGKYLYVGYQKRPEGKEDEYLTPLHHRRPMGRKGIGKLSLFSIANTFRVYTRMEGAGSEAFLMDAAKIREAIDAENPSAIGRYEPESIQTNGQVPYGHGTSIHITDLKKLRLTQASVNGLRRRIARRFSIIGDSYDFTVRVNGDPITVADRDYYHKARFIFQYDGDYAAHCPRLEEDEGGDILGAFSREHRFDEHGNASIQGPYAIRGWIAIAWRSNDLDGEGVLDSDNLNKITVVVRGKVAQEDILQEFRLGGMITKYMFGEIEADFLDQDNQPDIATSSRQRIAEDDARYRALAKFIQSELKAIWTQTNTLKERAGLRHALTSNPYLNEWYQSLRPARLKQFASKIFGDIDKAGIDESERQGAYANGVMLFEHLKMNHAIDLLDEIDVTKVDDFLSYLNDVDALEAEHYRQIVEERLAVIRRLRESLDDDAKERVLQEYIFDHLFLLDPGWERATRFDDLERRMEKVLENRQRIDIQYTRYRRVAAAHVIVELKRRSAAVTKTGLESQVTGYIAELKKELAKSANDNASLPIEAVCVVGRLPSEWTDEATRQSGEQSLRPLGIRVVTYDELIDNAYQAYGRFLEASASKSKLRELMDQIRTFDPDA
ncbi:MAG: ATP-binding protein [Gammaproteobacteria bacterium]|nr:ATP-binding protein [Gammaproteobacteria bacterium]